MMRSAAMPRSAFQRRKPPRAGRPAWKCADEFRRWLRALPCACGGKLPFCEGVIVAAHVDTAGKGTRDEKGASTKVADRFCIPLSHGCHRVQTDVLGWPEFQLMLPGGDAEALSERYWQEFPGRLAWERELAEQGL